VAARSYGVDANRYKALAFAFGGFGAGISGAIDGAPLFLSGLESSDVHAQLSMLALTMVILGGMGNVLGAILGAGGAGRAARTVPRSPPNTGC
jgi:branched-chain amino acid transport system permease protein